MTIHLPVELERSIRALVLGGQFTSEDQVVAEAVRSFLSKSDVTVLKTVTPGTAQSGSFIGSMRDAADELDEIVADAMKDRREQPWRLNSVE